MSGVQILIGAGVARVAGTSWPIAPAGDGALRLHDGPSLRPLRFGERSGLCRTALAAEDPALELAAAVLAVATLGAAVAHPAAAAIALHLAGAGGSETGFAMTQSLLARQLGWSPADVAAAPAQEVDVLADRWATAMQGTPSDWTRIVFSASAGHDDAGDADSLARSLADGLLRRAGAGIDPADPPPVDGATASPSGHPAQASPPRVAPSDRDAPQGAGPDDPLRRNVAPTLPAAQAARAAAQPVAQAGRGPRHGAGDTTRPAVFPSADARQGTSRTHPRRPVTPATGSAEPLWPPQRDLSASAAHTPLTERAGPDPWAIAPAARRGRESAQAPRRPMAASPGPVASFSGWFDDVPGAAVTADHPAASAPPPPAPWVWARTARGTAPLADHPETAPSATRDDPVAALADALHLACDIRGIAP